MNRRLYAALICCAVSFLSIAMLSGCARNRPYRTDLSPCECDLSRGKICTNSVVETTTNYTLGYIEFDDQGWYWRADQWDTIQKMVRDEANIEHTNNLQGVIMVLFVHGWKNNASYQSTNVGMFHNMLQEISDRENADATMHTRPARKVIGIYAGWRGLSAKVEPFKELSFWPRKTTAHKVGNAGALSELLVNLEMLQDASNATLITNAPKTELIIIGHSFGGAVVYSAICQMITERFVQTIPRHQSLKPLGDQVILLNPAFEAARHKNLITLAQSYTNYPEAQRPVVSIFTSKGDWATHYLFPTGRFFSNLFQSYRGSKQRAADRDAVGWYSDFITHELVSNVTNNVSIARSGQGRGSKELQDSVQNVRDQRKKWKQRKDTEKIPFNQSNTTLVSKPRYIVGDPFLVVSVDKTIMSGHDDIGNDRLITFLGEFIQFCQNDSGH